MALSCGRRVSQEGEERLAPLLPVAYDHPAITSLLH